MAIRDLPGRRRHRLVKRRLAAWLSGAVRLARHWAVPGPIGKIGPAGPDERGRLKPLSILYGSCRSPFCFLIPTLEIWKKAGLFPRTTEILVGRASAGGRRSRIAGSCCSVIDCLWNVPGRRGKFCIILIFPRNHDGADEGSEQDDRNDFKGKHEFPQKGFCQGEDRNGCQRCLRDGPVCFQEKRAEEARQN